MKNEKNILIAFVLNFFFSVFEALGGFFTGSITLVSDAVHDMGDAASIGIAWLLEKKSRQKPDDNYTYGYARYSVMGGMITNIILITGSLLVVYNAVIRMVHPVDIDFTTMIILSVIGLMVNGVAVFFTREGDSLNRRAVNLHMLEDVLSWIVVLISAIVMKFTGYAFLDPLMSVGIALFVLTHAIRHMTEITDIFFDRTPRGIDISHIRSELMELDGITDVHHIHIRSFDGYQNIATMHIVTDSDSYRVKALVREQLKKFNIQHCTLELEGSNEKCGEK
ncbi:MAG: cation transporter [Clostridia bacterium]|nr:cation transporter [Clostridia bacterium]